MKNPQTKRLIEAFKSNNNVLSLPEILDIRPRIGQYNSRISDLRAMGYVIKNETWWVKGEKHSKFTLVSEPKKYSSPNLSTINQTFQNPGIHSTSDFPSRAHEIAHENRLKAQEKEVKTDQLTLI